MTTDNHNKPFVSMTDLMQSHAQIPQLRERIRLLENELLMVQDYFNARNPGFTAEVLLKQIREALNHSDRHEIHTP
jgi:hypothetical protein